MQVMDLLPQMYIDAESRTYSIDSKTLFLNGTQVTEEESNVATVKKIYLCIGILFGVRSFLINDKKSGLLCSTFA